ncbi:MAG: hypothetical protein U9N04_03615 [Patescibacteria group bacterium]|nr:hypothetical protein [Patescibacteria group bacterium]
MTEVIEIGSWEISILWLPWYSYLLSAVKYFLMFYTAILFAAIVLILIRTQGSFKIRIKEAVEEAMEVGKLPKTKTQEKIEAISSAIESNKPEDYEKAVVLAGELLDRVLKAANFSGDTLKKRVGKVSANQLNFKEDIIWACELKEKILTDEEFKTDYEEAKRAVYIFQRALKEIGVI